MHTQKEKQVATLDAQGQANEKVQKVSDVQNQALGGSERVQELLDRVAVLRYQCNGVALKAQHNDVSLLARDAKGGLSTGVVMAAQVDC